MLEDNDIIELYNQRNENAIHETDCKYGRLLLRVSNNIVGCEEDAQECVSDTYLNVWNAIPPAKPVFFKAFLFQVVRNVSLNRLAFSHRKKRGSGVYETALEEIEAAIPFSGYGEQMVDEIFLKDVLNRFLEELSEEQRVVFIGRYWYFETINDMAQNLGIGVSRVKMMLKRSRDSLRETLKKEGIPI